MAQYILVFFAMYIIQNEHHYTYMHYNVMGQYLDVWFRAKISQNHQVNNIQLACEVAPHSSPTQIARSIRTG